MADFKGKIVKWQDLEYMGTLLRRARDSESEEVVRTLVKSAIVFMESSGWIEKTMPYIVTPEEADRIKRDFEELNSSKGNWLNGVMGDKSNG